jgi:acetylornithine deacetylase/succinyl-diaminopimelate desuccinylase-like protein
MFFSVLTASRWIGNNISRMRFLFVAIVALASLSLAAQSGKPDWKTAEAELIEHFQALVRFDTTDPPGNERPAADYLKKVLAAAGIETQEFALEAHRPNVVARLKGSGSKRPVLLMGHTDTVNVDPAKWTHPPFSAAREGGHIYGRGTVDDKDNVAASLMVMLLLKRLNVPLDRDVIFLAESGEEGSTRVGIQHMVNEHWAAMDAEFCLAEGGNGYRSGGNVRFMSIQTLEKIPYMVELVARGPAGHGSVPLETNAVAHVSAAVAAVARWSPPVRLNETTSAYFKRLAEISPPEDAQRYRDVLDPKKIDAVDAYFRKNEPRHASMLRTSISPNIVQAGYRINVIPSEAIARLDVRALQDENMPALLEQIRKVVNDPAVEVRMGQRDTRPGGKEARIDSEAFKTIEAAVRAHYNAPALPTMSTGATDMAYPRSKGMQCYGVGPATDVEDGPKGYGSHSDQERILESELTRFLRFYWDVVTALAGRK